MKHLLISTLRVCIVVALILAVGLSEKQNLVRAQSEDKALAVINGRSIKQREVDDSIISQLFPLEQQIYALRKVALENFIVKVILDNEAKKRGISVEELRKQLTTGKVEVPMRQVEEVYSENASVFGAMSPDEAKERLRLDLESQARMQLYREAISKLRATLQIDILLEEPRLPVSRESNAPSIGLKEAPVMIIEFSDFQCPFCRNSQLAIKQVLQKYKKEVRLVFKNLPLESHSQAFSSAQAAFCAGEKGAFWQYHDALFASEDLSPDALNKLASSLHLDLSEFTACMKSEASRMAVQRDINEAQRFGINSTPTFIINGRLFRGALSFEDFKTAIERELKSSQRDSRNQ